METNTIISAILQTLNDASIKGVYIGLHWTGVVVELDGKMQCGLAATLKATHKHDGESDIPEAGHLTELSALEVAHWVHSAHPTQVSLGMAAINALLPKNINASIECNAAEIILQKGQGKQVCLVGHFSFANKIKDKIEKLSILELDPQYGDIPASQAPHIIPNADIVAITGMTFINHTLEELLSYCSAAAYVMILGPSTPFTPLLFNYGIDLISGALITNVDAAVQTLMQGANFHQVRKAGAQLVTMMK